MGIDYDKIVEGRRRNWDPLKPDEVRQKEREEERERAREQQETKAGRRLGGYHQLRQRLKVEAERDDRARFRIALRQSIVLGSAFIFVLLAFIGIERLIEARRRAALVQTMDKYERVVDDGKFVHDLSTPVGAFATWRSAWARGDVKELVGVFSPRFYSHMAAGRGYNDVYVEYKRLFDTGRLQPTRELAEAFAGAEMLRIPKPPWKNEEIALFRSPHLQIIHEPPPGKRYIAAFSYDANSKSWRFADVREDKYFSVLWDYEAKIRPLRIGPAATTFDESGRAIQKRQNVRTSAGDTM